MDYTRGQWRELVDTIANAPVIMDDSGRTLAKLWDGSFEEKQANAHLIKAAPAMYEVLLAVYRDIDLQNVKGGSDELNISVQYALEQAEGKA